MGSAQNQRPTPAPPSPDVPERATPPTENNGQAIMSMLLSKMMETQQEPSCSTSTSLRGNYSRVSSLKRKTRSVRLQELSDPAVVADTLKKRCPTYPDCQACPYGGICLLTVGIKIASPIQKVFFVVYDNELYVDNNFVDNKYVFFPCFFKFYFMSFFSDCRRADGEPSWQAKHHKDEVTIPVIGVLA